MSRESDLCGGRCPACMRDNWLPMQGSDDPPGYFQCPCGLSGHNRVLTSIPREVPEDKALLGKLLTILSRQLVTSEGAVEVLERIIAERDKLKGFSAHRRGCPYFVDVTEPGITYFQLNAKCTCGLGGAG